MRVAIAADHAGFELKQHLAGWLRESGHDVIDLGTTSTEPVDYPDYAAAAGHAVGAEEGKGKVGHRAATYHEVWQNHKECHPSQS